MVASFLTMALRIIWLCIGLIVGVAILGGLVLAFIDEVRKYDRGR